MIGRDLIVGFDLFTTMSRIHFFIWDAHRRSDECVEWMVMVWAHMGTGFAIKQVRQI
jgi:hypothetical protein